MCGRFRLEEEPLDLLAHFRLLWPEVFAARPEIFPGQEIVAVLQETGRELRLAQVRWGLVPSWAKDETVGRKLFNARVETIREKPSFRDAARHRRCLIPASGYWEWQALRDSGGADGGGKKIRHYFAPEHGGQYVFAGIWERWAGRASGGALLSAAILTTVAAGPVAAIHDRMPVVLPLAADWDCWLHDGILPAV